MHVKGHVRITVPEILDDHGQAQDVLVWSDGILLKSRTDYLLASGGVVEILIRSSRRITTVCKTDSGTLVKETWRRLTAIEEMKDSIESGHNNHEHR